MKTKICKYCKQTYTPHPITAKRQRFCSSKCSDKYRYRNSHKRRTQQLIYSKKRYEENKEKYIKLAKEYYEKNKDKINKRKKAYNTQYKRIYRKNNKEAKKRENIRSRCNWNNKKKKICKKCNYKGYTQWHHISYEPEMKVELCKECHKKEHKIKNKY